MNEMVMIRTFSGWGLGGVFFNFVQRLICFPIFASRIIAQTDHKRMPINDTCFFLLILIRVVLSNH